MTNWIKLTLEYKTDDTEYARSIRTELQEDEDICTTLGQMTAEVFSGVSRYSHTLAVAVDMARELSAFNSVSIAEGLDDAAVKLCNGASDYCAAWAAYDKKMSERVKAMMDRAE